MIREKRSACKIIITYRNKKVLWLQNGNELPYTWLSARYFPLENSMKSYVPLENSISVCDIRNDHRRNNHS